MIQSAHLPRSRSAAKSWRPGFVTRSAVLLTFLTSTVMPSVLVAQASATPPPEPSITPPNQPSPADSFGILMSCMGQPGALRENTSLGANSAITTSGVIPFAAIHLVTGATIATAGVSVKDIYGLPMFSRDCAKKVNAGRAANDQREITVSTIVGQLSGTSCGEY